MNQYSGLCDEYYINLNLNTEMELPTNRDTLSHYFEQLKKRYPTMKNFYSRERGDYVLEEDKDSGSYRWATVEQKRICSGYVNPPEASDAMEQHRAVLELLPYTLSVSPLDCESLNYMLGFDFNYQGNHHALLAEALGIAPAYEPLTQMDGVKIVSNEPAIQLALEDDCRTQCRISIDAKTSAYNIRSGEFAEEAISVYVTLRQYGSLTTKESFVEHLNDLKMRADEIMDKYVIENILRPLQQTIAIK